MRVRMLLQCLGRQHLFSAAGSHVITVPYHEPCNFALMCAKHLTGQDIFPRWTIPTAACRPRRNRRAQPTRSLRRRTVSIVLDGFSGPFSVSVKVSGG